VLVQLEEEVTLRREEGIGQLVRLESGIEAVPNIFKLLERPQLGFKAYCDRENRLQDADRITDSVGFVAGDKAFGSTLVTGRELLVDLNA